MSDDEYINSYNYAYGIERISRFDSKPIIDEEDAQDDNPIDTDESEEIDTNQDEIEDEAIND